MSVKYFMVFFMFISCCTYAEMHWIKSEKVKPEDVNTVKIIYTGDVNSRKVSELISAIDEINNDYPEAKVIRIFITSFGGSMESGYLGMQAVRGSKIPVETINAGMTGSSATLIYCGTEKRSTLPEASFMLHPSASPNIKTEWIRPNDVELLKKDVDDGNKYFRSIYKTCTNLSDEEIQRILYSNDNARYLTASEAEGIKLSQGNISGIYPTPVSYYITDDNN
ncbi:ATP-dependent Clp protease proteolytic subunit [Serratia marcescens]